MTGMSFNIRNIITFFSMLSPYFITFYFIMDSAFNSHLKGVWYLFGLMWTLIFGILARGLFPDSIRKENKDITMPYKYVSAMCQVFEGPFETKYGRFRAPSDHAIFHFFTLAYILPNAINNPNFNGWFLLTFLLISCVMDIFFRVSVKMCEKPKHIAIGAVFGIIFGVAWYFLTKVFNEKLTYYNTVEGSESNKRCKTSKQKFKCTYN